MGYTHYFTFKKPARGQASKTEKLYQLAIKDCQKIILKYSADFGGLSGYSAHTSNYAGINFNGSDRVGGCENFVLREHYNENIGFQSCKTAGYSYDVVVVACLVALKARLGDLITIGSDGDLEEWALGLITARAYLRRKALSIPNTITRRGES